MKTKLLVLLPLLVLTARAQSAQPVDWAGTITQTVTATNDPADYYIGETYIGSYSYTSPTIDGAFYFNNDGLVDGVPPPANTNESLSTELYFFELGLNGSYGFSALGSPDQDKLIVSNGMPTLDLTIDFCGILESTDSNVFGYGTDSAVYYDAPVPISDDEYVDFSLVLSDPVDPPFLVSIPDAFCTAGVAGLLFALILALSKHFALGTEPNR